MNEATVARVRGFTVRMARRIGVPRALIRLLAAVVVAPALSLPLGAQTSDSSNEFWPEFDLLYQAQREVAPVPYLLRDP
jgi:hypothetical protein